MSLPLVLSLPLSLALAGCAEEDSPDVAKRDVVLSFAATVGELPADCSTTYTGLGTSGASAQLADARLFVSQVELRDASGAWTALTLDDSIWQSSDVALLDFEDGSGACADSGTEETNDIITGTLPAGAYDGVRFTLGIPFALNHIDATNAEPPFNVPGMFWVWQGGFKFVRVDWKVEGGEVPRWNVHTGSTACESIAPTVAPEAPCARPNLGSVTLGGFDIDADTIAIDLAQLVAAADLNLNTEATAPGCMSGSDEPAECAPVFAALGMDFATGTCDAECAGQSVFAATR